MMPLPPHPGQLLGMCLSSGSEALAQGRTQEPAGRSAAVVVLGGEAPCEAARRMSSESSVRVQASGAAAWRQVKKIRAGKCL